MSAPADFLAIDLQSKKWQVYRRLSEAGLFLAQGASWVAVRRILAGNHPTTAHDLLIVQGLAVRAPQARAS